MTDPHEMRVYPTVAAARNALSLDFGFDPFSCRGGQGVQDESGRIHRRPTKAALAALGYVVDRREHERIHREHLCTVCQAPVAREWTGTEYEQPAECPRHRRWSFSCDNGHRWQATDAEDAAAGHKCPTCGEYWV